MRITMVLACLGAALLLAIIAEPANAWMLMFAAAFNILAVAAWFCLS